MKGQVPEHLKAFTFKPGQSGNPNGRLSPREAVVKELLELLQREAPGSEGVSYAEQMLQRILESERLTGKLIDKLLPDYPVTADERL